MKLSKKWLFPVAAVVGIVVMVIYVSSSSVKIPAQKPISEPSIVPFKSYIGASGITEPNSENISVGTNKPGIVKMVNFTVGQSVKKDDLLFVIENSEIQAAAEQARAELKNAQSQFDMIAALTDKRAVSKQERNQKENDLALSQAKFNEAQAALELHNVRAPVDGVILSSNVRVGEFASSGALNDPLVRIGNLTPMHIRVSVDENDAWRFKPGAKAIGYVRSNNDIKADLEFVRVEPYVRPKQSLTGDSAERVDTRVLQVIFKFDVGDLPIYPGQQMDVYIEDTSGK